LSPDIIRKRLDYWTFVLGPKFSAKERERLNLSRFYAIAMLAAVRFHTFFGDGQAKGGLAICH
jgi:hypothetical protein